MTIIHLAGFTRIVGATRKEFDSWPSTRAGPHVNARATAPHGTLAHWGLTPRLSSVGRATVRVGRSVDRQKGMVVVTMLAAMVAVEECRLRDTKPAPRGFGYTTTGIWEVAEGITDHAARSSRSVLPFYLHRSGVSATMRRCCCRTPDAAPSRWDVASQRSSFCLPLDFWPSLLSKLLLSCATMWRAISFYRSKDLWRLLGFFLFFSSFFIPFWSLTFLLYPWCYNW